MNLLHCEIMILLGLLVLELKLSSFSVFFDCLVFLPVLNSFLEPFLHETCISLKFIDLSSSDLLLYLVLSFLLQSFCP